MMNKNSDFVNTAEKQKILFLKNITEILEENKIDYWIEFGTLLGYVREKRLLPWDPDIDIVVLNLNKVKTLKNEINKRGLVIESEHNNYFSTKKIIIKDKKISEMSGMHIDIFEFEILDEKPIYKFVIRNNYLVRFTNTLYHAICMNSPVKSGKTPIKVIKMIMDISNLIPDSIKKILILSLNKVDIELSDKRMFIFPEIKTKLVDFYDFKVRIPEDAKKHLLLIYGINWEKPDKNFFDHGGEYIKQTKNGIKICKIS